jgi:dihydroflavonol-4-reductase
MEARMERFWQDKWVCVTGGGGFLGLQIVRLLLERGARVRSFGLAVKPEHPLQGLGVEHLVGDIRDAAAVRRAVAGCDVIFHTAGLVAVWGPALGILRDVHVEGTGNVLAAAGNARVVHTSSVVAVGASPRGQLLDEDAIFNLSKIRMDYVHAKRAAEELVVESAARGQDAVVVNPSYLLGPEDYEGSPLGKLCKRVWKGHLLVAPPGGLNLVDVRDAALGHLLAAERGQAGRRYILGNVNLRMHELIRRLCTVSGRQPRWLPRLPLWTMRCLAGLGTVRACFTGREPALPPQQMQVNRYCWFYRSDRAKRELGYQPRPLDETLADTLRWQAERTQFSLGRFQSWWLRPRSLAA